MSEKNTLIQKLEVISSLHQKALAIRKKMIDYEPEDLYERKVEVPPFPGEYENSEDREAWESFVEHSDDDAIEQMAATYDKIFSPKKPLEPKIEKFEYKKSRALEEKKSKIGCFSYIAACICGFFLLGALVGGGFDEPSERLPVLGIAALAAVVFVGFRFIINSIKKAESKKESIARAEYDNEVGKIKSEYNNKLTQYENESVSFKLRRGDFLEKYSQWRKVYLEHVEEEAEIAEKLEEDRQAGMKAIEKEELMPVLKELAEINDLITTDYLPAIDVIIDLLKSGRADDLKEAINLHEDIVYRERQLQLQREKEEQRRREEAQRRQDEERRYREEVQFREKQERQRQREEERRQQDAERRHREEMEQRDRAERDRQYQEQRRADEERRRANRAELDRKMDEDRATRRQCNTCALCGNCSMSFTRPNCTSYRPR